MIANFSPAMRSRLFITGGSLSVAAGVAGIVLPALPTTPFLLLAAFCYLRGSPRLYNALLRRRFVGSYLRNYLEGRGMALRTKIYTLVFLWATVILSALLATDNPILRIVLVLVLVGVTAHIVLLRTADRHPRGAGK